MAPRKSREAQGARNTLQRQLETPKCRRRRDVHYQDGRKRREGRRGGRWAAEVAGRRSMGVPDRKSTAKVVCCSESRGKEKRSPGRRAKEHDGAEEGAENGMRAVGQPVAPKEKRKPKKNTRRRMTAPRETQAKQLRQDAIGKRRAVETAGNGVSLTQAVTERRRCRKGGCNQGNSEALERVK